MKFYYQTFLH